MTRSTGFILALLLATGSLACGTGRKAQWEGPAGSDRAWVAPAPLDEADSPAAASWGARGDRKSLERAIAHWVDAPPDAETLARLARAHYFMADAHLRAGGPNDEQYLATFEKGISAGERALAAISPEFKARVTKDERVEEAIKVVGKEGIDAMYWYAVNLGKWSRAKGLAALLGNKDRVRGVIERVLALDEAFFHGAPHRYFGAYFALLPVGRDLEKSRQHFERSLALAPAYAGTKVLMAETYAVKKQDRALFDKLLGEVLAMPDNAIPGLEPETRVEKEKARELQEKADELF